jgi:hypothetical protein
MTTTTGGKLTQSENGMVSSGHGRGGFFAVDRRAWAHVCTLGMNAAITYLILARGTGGDQRTTAWSVNAVETYTGISRQRARKAIEALSRASLVVVTQTGTRPRYVINSAHEVPDCDGYPRPVLDWVEKQVFDQLLAGFWNVPERVVPKDASEYGRWSTRRPREIACQLVTKGWARDLGAGRYMPVAYDAEAAAKPDWIWLPNTLIDGAGGDLAAPVELLRQTQSVSALRLLIDLYHAQNLESDGGIHWRKIRQDFTRHKVGEHGQFVIYGFEENIAKAWGSEPFVRVNLTGKIEMGEDGKPTRDEGWSVFWEAWKQLVNLGLVELVGHLIEADTAEAEILHPYAIGDGEVWERSIAVAAHAAGHALLTEAQQRWAERHELRLVPVRAHITEVQMVGIARLSYRPRTRSTAAWFARMAEWEEVVRNFRQLAEKFQKGAGLTNKQHQGASR